MTLRCPTSSSCSLQSVLPLSRGSFFIPPEDSNSPFLAFPSDEKKETVLSQHQTFTLIWNEERDPPPFFPFTFYMSCEHFYNIVLPFSQRLSFYWWHKSLSPVTIAPDVIVRAADMAINLTSSLSL